MNYTSLVILGAVFVAATLVTAFALTLFSSSSGAPGFFARFWQNALRYGWVCGVAVAAVFWLMTTRLAP